MPLSVAPIGYHIEQMCGFVFRRVAAPLLVLSAIPVAGRAQHAQTSTGMLPAASTSVDQLAYVAAIPFDTTSAPDNAPGDTLTQNKPHPDPLLHACRDIGSNPANCVYVGDAKRDIEAARRAGMPSLVAMFGYLMEGDRPDQWGANALIEQPSGILDWIGENTCHAG